MVDDVKETLHGDDSLILLPTSQFRILARVVMTKDEAESLEDEVGTMLGSLLGSRRSEVEIWRKAGESIGNGKVGILGVVVSGREVGFDETRTGGLREVLMTTMMKIIEGVIKVGVDSGLIANGMERGCSGWMNVCVVHAGTERCDCFKWGEEVVGIAMCWE